VFVQLVVSLETLLLEEPLLAQALVCLCWRPHIHRLLFESLAQDSAKYHVTHHNRTSELNIWVYLVLAQEQMVD
jgi:hypothetical protein